LPYKNESVAAEEREREMPSFSEELNRQGQRKSKKIVREFSNISAMAAVRYMTTTTTSTAVTVKAGI
jgi:hypothetical protein